MSYRIVEEKMMLFETMVRPCKVFLIPAYTYINPPPPRFDINLLMDVINTMMANWLIIN